MASCCCKSLTLMYANLSSLKFHQRSPITNWKFKIEFTIFFQFFKIFKHISNFNKTLKITLHTVHTTHNDHSHVLLANTRTDGLTRTSSLRRGGYSTEAGRGLWNQPLWCSKILARNMYAWNKNYENDLFENLSSTQDMTFLIITNSRYLKSNRIQL